MNIDISNLSIVELKNLSDRVNKRIHVIQNDFTLIDGFSVHNTEPENIKVIYTERGRLSCMLYLIRSKGMSLKITHDYFADNYSTITK